MASFIATEPFQNQVGSEDRCSELSGEGGLSYIHLFFFSLLTPGSSRLIFSLEDTVGLRWVICLGERTIFSMDERNEM